jgi:hypothetical protein
VADPHVYRPFLLRQALGAAPVVFATDTLKWCLVAGTYTPDWNTHEFYSSITGELTTANGYTIGGLTVTGINSTLNTGDNRAEIDSADPTWTLTGQITFRYAVLLKSTGNAATSPLIGALDFGVSGRVEEAGTFGLEFPSTGFLPLAAAAGQ